MALSTGLIEAFLLGLATPLTALCVLPLYPGFITYLANTAGDDDSIIRLASLVCAGVISFMLILGFVFTTLLRYSLTNVIGIVAPIAYLFLLGFGIALLFNITLPVQVFAPPEAKTSSMSAYLYGVFFGVIIIPCNPAFIAYFFADLLTKTGQSIATSLATVIAFGTGIAVPLFILAVASQPHAKTVISWLTTYKREINAATGAFLILVSLYYLLFDFAILSF